MSKYIAKWTGKFPNLCMGEWILLKDNKDYSEYIPEDLRTSYMNTYGTYAEWHFVNWLEEWNSYTDGLNEKEWIEQNKEWLKSIGPTEDFPLIFRAFQESDWRYSSCGGCI